MALPETMQAWTETIGKHEPIRKRVPIPRPGPDEVLIKVLAMGVCHSDCALVGLEQPLPGMRHEFTLGHEACGEIVQLGADVDRTQHAIGDTVAMLVCPGCDSSKCRQCSRGLHALCRDPENSGNYGLGFSDGAFAEYVAIKARAAIKVPAGVDIAQAAVSADAVMTAYYAVRYTANVQPDETIAIFGLGGVGLNGLQTALHLGPKRILVADKRQSTLEEAVKLGIAKEDTFCTDDKEAKSLERFVTEHGIEVDTVLDFVGHTDTVQSAQVAVRSGGTIVLVGLISPVTPLIPFLTVIKGLTIKGSYSGTREAMVECLDLMAKGVLKPQVEVRSVVDLPEVLRDLDEGRIKSRMVLLPDWERQAVS